VKDFVVARVYDAPRERVWQAWTEPERLKQWWSPPNFTTHTCKVDLRPGGMFLYGMRAPDGTEVWGRFIYREIVAPEKLVFIVSFSDAQGGRTRHPWSEHWPLDILSTVTFEAQGARTKVTVRWTPHEASELERKAFDEGRGSLAQGWGGTLDHLTAYLESGRA
jgi:uncharacterized protein YndB with AHSA1/START domain